LSAWTLVTVVAVAVRKRVTTVKQTGQGSIAVVDEAALHALDPQPECEIVIAGVDYTYEMVHAVAYVTRVTVRGAAWGADEVRAAVRGAGAEATTNVHNARWSVDLDLPPTGVRYGATVTVTATMAGVDDDEQCTGEDEQQVTLGASGSTDVPLLADGCIAGFEPARAPMVAGHPDRLVRSRSYVPLLCSFTALTVDDRSRLARLVTRLGTPREVAFDVVDDFVRRMDDIGREFRERPRAAGGAEAMRPAGDMPSLLAAVDDAFTAAATAAAQRLAEARGGTARPAAKGHEDGGRVATRPAVGGIEYGLILPAPPDAGTVDPHAGFAGYQGATATVRGNAIGVKGGITKYVNLGWLGILFYDRLRFRASGVTAGEQVYSLALAPGEEVTLTQRSETKRSRSFEDVIDRTTERELEFSSTWSTDFNQTDADSQTSTVGGNLGVSVGIPLEGVEIGINAGVSAQDSHTISSSTQRARTQEVTTRVTAKAREEHKTTFKVGTDITEEFGSKRVVRNANPSRALTLEVYKLYQKYRVVLERYDAKLCLSLGLHDPGRDLRTELEQELAKLDPVVPPGACPDIPAGGSAVQSEVIENLNSTDAGGDEFGRALFTTVLPAGTILSGWSFRITSWTIDLGDGTERGADVDEFAKYGGNWWFIGGANMPVIGSASAQSHQIAVLMPEAWGPGWWTVRVTGEFTWRYAPSEVLSQEVRTCMDEEKKRIRDSFSADRVEQILEEIRASGRELILKRLFEEVLLPGYFPQGINPPIDVLERIRNYFDWNEASIEYLPWWMTASGRQQRDLLRLRLLDLPGPTRSDLIIDDLLVASAARIFLPIKRGLEHEVVTFLVKVGHYDVPPLGPCIDDFISWREHNCGAVVYPLPTSDQVLAPTPAVATPTGAADWASDWEKPRRRFLVLDEWADLLPTDGVHFEPSLSTCGANDEYRSSALVSDLRGAAAMQDAERARAELERQLGGREDLEATIVIGDPSGHLRG
jgi:hypothetical protein